jgi:integrase/recombinase XerD
MVLEDLFRRPSALARFRLPPLGPHMDGFCDWLRPQGFSRWTLRHRIGQTSHFNQCLRKWSVKTCHEVSAAHGERFLRRHLPHCRCRGGRRGARSGAHGAVHSLIEYLSERALLAEPPPPDTAYHEVLQRYLDYLRDERHLSETTVKSHRRCLIPFLESLGTPLAAKLQQLSPEHLLAYFTQYSQTSAPSAPRCLQGVLRRFCRLCRLHGYLERDLEASIPPLRHYRLGAVPQGINAEEARKTLQCIDRTTATGRRDFALILLPHTYGVRGGQLRALRVHDIDWRGARIRFPAAKGGKDVLVPLTDAVAESLVEYLRHGRAPAPYPEVFLTAQPPFRPLRCPATVSLRVARRLREAGVVLPRAGSHSFRHGFATQLLEQGESLKTIADLLGHRNLNTTFIYTKVDFNALRQLPLEWPEV